MHAFATFDGAFADVPHLVCYAMKANASLAILDLFAQLGSGFDIVSGGELARVLAAGGDPAKVVFSGVGKSDAEMEAALASGILCFNVESASELDHLAAVAARMGKVAPDQLSRQSGRRSAHASVHRDRAQGEQVRRRVRRRACAVSPRGAACRRSPCAASTCTSGRRSASSGRTAKRRSGCCRSPMRCAADGIALEHIDLGGGLGIRYRDETPVAIDDYAQMVRELMRGRRERLLFEPGRRLVGDAGVLLTRVRVVKPGAARNFAIVDAAMNDLLRPSLYGAWHDVDPVRPRGGAQGALRHRRPDLRERRLSRARSPARARAKAIFSPCAAAGAYGMSMSSNYNARPRACEVLVDGDVAHLVRRRETTAELFAHETRLPQRRGA